MTLWLNIILQGVLTGGLYAMFAAGLSLIVVEQDIAQALKAARRVYCLQEGRVALQGQAAEMTRAGISAAYFGV